MRDKFYKELLRRVCEDPDTNWGFCFYIKNMRDWCNDNNTPWMNPYYYLDAVAPELAALEPKHKGDYWYPRTYKGWEKRIALLEKIIHKLESNGTKRMVRRNTKTNNPKL